MDNRPSEGVYDLEIEGATYDRDNGQFECRMKEGGSGRELHSKSVTVTGWFVLGIVYSSHTQYYSDSRISDIVTLYGNCKSIKITNLSQYPNNLQYNTRIIYSILVLIILC